MLEVRFSAPLRLCALRVKSFKISTRYLKWLYII
jgi:hypothetical protein